MSCLMCQAYDELMKAFAERNKVSNLCVDSSLTKNKGNKLFTCDLMILAYVAVVVSNF